MLFKKMAVSLILAALTTIIPAGIYVYGHGSNYAPPSDDENEALSCNFGTSFITPDGESGNNLVIIINESKYRLRIFGKGVFSQGYDLDSHFCLKRFFSQGVHTLEITAYEMKTYPWIKPLREWFAVGGKDFMIEIPNVDHAVLFAEITDKDLKPYLYSVSDYLQKNRFQIFSILLLYAYTVFAITFPPYIIWKGIIKKQPKN